MGWQRIQTKHYARCFAVALTIFAVAADAWAVNQCPGVVTGLGSDEMDSELAVGLAPEQDCGCLNNRFVVPGAASGRKIMHADLLAALLSGTRVSLGYSNDPATAPWCHLHNVSLMR